MWGIVPWTAIIAFVSLSIRSSHPHFRFPQIQLLKTERSIALLETPCPMGKTKWHIENNALCVCKRGYIFSFWKTYSWRICHVLKGLDKSKFWEKTTPSPIPDLSSVSTFSTGSTTLETTRWTIQPTTPKPLTPTSPKPTVPTSPKPLPPTTPKPTPPTTPKPLPPTTPKRISPTTPTLLPQPSIPTPFPLTFF